MRPTLAVSRRRPERPACCSSASSMASSDHEPRRHGGHGIKKFLRVSVSPWLVVLLLGADRAAAQTDLTGTWRPLARNEDGSGMIGDAAGLPITQESRWRAD